MRIETFYPQDSLLKKYVEYYYFFKSDSPGFNETYYSFPNVTQVLNIHRNAECEIKPNFTGVYGNSQNDYLTIVQGCCELPLLVNLCGRLDKVTIIFKPLGLNRFISKPFKEILGKLSRVFTEWDSKDYKKFLGEFYGTNDTKTRAVLFEDFMLTRFNLFGEGEILQKALDQLSDFENESSVEDIARAVNLNVRSLKPFVQQKSRHQPNHF